MMNKLEAIIKIQHTWKNYQLKNLIDNFLMNDFMNNNYKYIKQL